MVCMILSTGLIFLAKYFCFCKSDFCAKVLISIYFSNLPVLGSISEGKI